MPDLLHDVGVGDHELRMSRLPTGTVTFLFTDLEGSTRLWEEQPDAMRAAVARHDEFLRGSVTAQGGAIFKTGGDAFCVVFERAAEAVTAALEAQLSLTREPWGEIGALRARMALHTGAADARNGDYFGPALNRVARLLAIGHGGQTLLSLATAVLVRDSLPAGVSLRDQGSHRLRDLQQPEQVFQLAHPGLPADFPPLRSLDSLPNNLPLQPTSFIGRDREMAELRHRLADTRLLTLTGAGGSGKTRLALQIAAELLEEFPEGVWVVELASLSDPALVPNVVATALGLRETPGRPLTETLAESLKPRKLLLVLDNCEQVVEACARLAAVLMRSCPRLTILATSREAFGAPGELVWPVPSLAAPAPNPLSKLGDRPSSIGDYEAVRLFLDRARLSQPAFALTEGNAPAVAQICQRLDGIPLAIELAAGRVKVLSPEQIAARLDDRFRLLTGGSRTVIPRHQTLRAAMDWSYELLAEPERKLLRRLSVFAGGWPLEAAETICADESLESWEVLELLTHLVDKSLVVVERDAGGETRHRLLGTIRQYARDRLLEAGEAGPVRDRHLEWFLALAESAVPELRGADQAVWLNRLEQEHDNFRGALEWSLTRKENVEAALRLGGALYRFWLVRGHTTEGRQWLEAALARGGGASPAVRARALLGAGHLASIQVDLEAGRPLLEESLALYRELGDKRSLARALNTLGIVASHQGDEAGSQAFYEEGLPIAREIGATDLVAAFLNNLGERARLRGDHLRARELYEQALALPGSVAPNRAVMLLNMGLIALAQSDFVAARSFVNESLGIMTRVGDKRGIANNLEFLAGVWGATGEPERAARLLGAAEEIRKAINAPVQAADLADYERFVAAARERLEPDAFATAWAEGQAMTLEEAVTCALEEPTGMTQDAKAPPAR